MCIQCASVCVCLCVVECTVYKPSTYIPNEFPFHCIFVWFSKALRLYAHYKHRFNYMVLVFCMPFFFGIRMVLVYTYPFVPLRPKRFVLPLFGNQRRLLSFSFRHLLCIYVYRDCCVYQCVGAYLRARLKVFSFARNVYDFVLYVDVKFLGLLQCPRQIFE